MKHFTLIPKLLSSLRAPVLTTFMLALFAGIGTPQTAQAQSSITDNEVTINAKGTVGVYNTQSSTVGGNDFTERSFGTFDVTGDVFTLDGAKLTINEDPADNFDQGELLVRIFSGSLANNNGATAFTSIALVNGGNTGGVRTFTLNNAGQNILASVTAAGAAPGTSYRLDVRFRATDNVGGTILTSTIRRSVFQATGTVPTTTSINRSNVLVSPNTTANNITYGYSTGIAPDFNNANLGSYDINIGKLYLNGGSTTVFTANGDQVNSVSLNYRVYKDGTTSSASYTSLPLTAGTTTNRTTTYTLTDAQQNLINGQVAGLGPGTFDLQVFFSAAITQNSNAAVLSDNNNGVPFTAQFTTTGTAIATSTWISTSSTNWLDPANWNHGVPNRNVSAVIPAKDEVPNIVFPTLDNPAALYEVQNLTLNGTENATRALVRIGVSTGGVATGATLRIYGDLNNIAGGLLAGTSGTNGSANAQTNSTLVFAGDAQTVTNVGGSSQFTNGDQKIFGNTIAVDIRIEGTGVKSVYNQLNAPNTITFAPGISAIVRTVKADGSLNTTQTSFVDLKDSGTLFGETTTAYIQGTTKADRSLTANVKQTFGNIGIDIMPNRDIPAPNVAITRTVGNPFGGPVGSSARGVKRQYGVTGDVNNNTTSDVVFHYLNSTDELNGNPEPNLVMFRTSNNGVPFVPLGGTVDLTNQTVTILAYSGPINTVTLGDKNNPLPVTLTSFTVVRKNSSVLVTWATATETNNKGFYVQESADGTTFHTVGFVVSQATNSTKALQYSFTDAETTTAGTRYYRLQQMDLNGKVAYFGPRVVQMDGAITANSATAYPNPFTGSLSLDLVSPSAGPALVRINDLTGRLVREQAFSALAGTSTLALDGVNDLKSGIYVLQFVSPTGKTTNLKVVKQ